MKVQVNEDMCEGHGKCQNAAPAVFRLREDDVEVIQARIVERLQVSRPAVSEMIRRLEAERLVTITGTRIDLTPDGHALAQRDRKSVV